MKIINLNTQSAGLYRYLEYLHTPFIGCTIYTKNITKVNQKIEIQILGKDTYRKLPKFNPLDIRDESREYM